MSLVRWEPFTNLDESINQLLPSLFGPWSRMAFDKSAIKYEWKPTADISESDTEYLIRAELPAVKKEDVKVTIDSGVITIQGERKQQKAEKSEKMHRSETFYGSFSRSFSLPNNVDPNTIRCDSKDGVLTVHVPKPQIKQPAQPKQIRVE